MMMTMIMMLMMTTMTMTMASMTMTMMMTMTMTMTILMQGIAGVGAYCLPRQCCCEAYVRCETCESVSAPCRMCCVCVGRAGGSERDSLWRSFWILDPYPYPYSYSSYSNNCNYD